MLPKTPIPFTKSDLALGVSLIAIISLVLLPPIQLTGWVTQQIEFAPSPIGNNGLRLFFYLTLFIILFMIGKEGKKYLDNKPKKKPKKKIERKKKRKRKK